MRKQLLTAVLLLFGLTFARSTSALTMTFDVEDKNVVLNPSSATEFTLSFYATPDEDTDIAAFRFELAISPPANNGQVKFKSFIVMPNDVDDLPATSTNPNPNGFLQNSFTIDTNNSGLAWTLQGNTATELLRLTLEVPVHPEQVKYDFSFVQAVYTTYPFFEEAAVDTKIGGFIATPEPGAVLPLGAMAVGMLARRRRTAKTA